MPSEIIESLNEVDFKEPYANLLEKLSGWLQSSIKLLPHFIAALLILSIFYMFAKLISKGFDNYIGCRFHSRTVANFTSFFIKAIIILAGFMVAIGILGLDKTLISILAGAGIAGLALGLAFQELAANIISGLTLGVKKPFRRGDLVRINNYFGEIIQLDLRTTEIKGRNGEIITMPNKEMLHGTLVNYSSSGILRKKLEVGVSYNEDLERVSQIIKDALSSLKFIRQDKGVQVYIAEFSDYAIKLSVRFWYNFPHSEIDYRESEHMAFLAIKKAFDRHSIAIPFPIQTLDFGIHGGKTLSEELKEAKL